MAELIRSHVKDGILTLINYLPPMPEFMEQFPYLNLLPETLEYPPYRRKWWGPLYYYDKKGQEKVLDEHQLLAVEMHLWSGSLWITLIPEKYGDDKQGWLPPDVEWEILCLQNGDNPDAALSKKTCAELNRDSLSESPYASLAALGRRARATSERLGSPLDPDIMLPQYAAWQVRNTRGLTPDFPEYPVDLPRPVPGVLQTRDP